MSLVEEIAALKEKQNAIILAHYYVPEEVQKVADHIGDSFYLAKVAAGTNAQTIVFCGVHFMSEGAKILCPEKRVLLPAPSADCPMAHMASAETIKELKEKISDLAVVCYINSTAALKSLADVCVTSSNAVKIVKSLPEKNILFIPDENLGSFVAAAVPEKKFYYSGGYCPVHAAVKVQDVIAAKKAHPDALLLTHPECKKEVCELSDYIGSTAGIISFAEKSDKKSFLVCTEPGVLSELYVRCPDKEFYPVTGICEDMKMITLERVLNALKTGEGEVPVEKWFEKARRPLERMLELG